MVTEETYTNNSDWKSGGSAEHSFGGYAMTTSLGYSNHLFVTIT